MITEHPTAAVFTLDMITDILGQDVVFPGHTFGDHWNGWATPMFTKEQADAVAKALTAAYLQMPDWCPITIPGDYAWYDADKDAFVNFYDEMGEVEEWTGSDIEIDGKLTRIYAIGAYCWTWDTVITQEVA